MTETDGEDDGDAEHQEEEEGLLVRDHREDSLQLPDTVTRGGGRRVGQAAAHLAGAALETDVFGFVRVEVVLAVEGVLPEGRQTAESLDSALRVVVDGPRVAPTPVADLLLATVIYAVTGYLIPGIEEMRRREGSKIR